MHAFRSLSLVSILLLGAAQAAADPPRQETIIVTAKRPAVIATDETVIVEPVIAPQDFAGRAPLAPPRLDYTTPAARPPIALARAEPDKPQG